MAKNSVGVYQKDNGYWEYRFVMMVDGKQINKKKSTDAQGNKLKTKTEAIRAREAAMAAARTERAGKHQKTAGTGHCSSQGKGN